MSGAKTCPKCDGEMKNGYVKGTGAVQMYSFHFTDKISFWETGNIEKTEPKTITNLDIAERVALSVGLSLAMVPLVGLLLNYTFWGIRLVPIVSSLFALTVILAVVAVTREHQARLQDPASKTHGK